MKFIYIFIFAVLNYSSLVYASTESIDECIKCYGFSEVFSHGANDDAVINPETLDKALRHYNEMVSATHKKKKCSTVVYVTALLKNIVFHIIKNKNVELMEKILLEDYLKQGDGELGSLVSEQQLILILFFENIDYYLSNYNIDRLAKHVVWPEASFFKNSKGECKTVLPSLLAQEIYCDELYDKIKKQSSRLALKIRNSYEVNMTCKMYSRNFCTTTR